MTYLSALRRACERATQSDHVRWHELPELLPPERLLALLAVVEAAQKVVKDIDDPNVYSWSVTDLRVALSAIDASEG